MNIHMFKRNGVFTVRASRGVFVANASSSDRKEAYACAVDRLNKKARGVYAPIDIYPGFVG